MSSSTATTSPSWTPLASLPGRLTPSLAPLLMNQNIPEGLQVTIPAALRGVNEFSNIR